MYILILYPYIHTIKVDINQNHILYPTFMYFKKIFWFPFKFNSLDYKKKGISLEFKSFPCGIFFWGSFLKGVLFLRVGGMWREVMYIYLMCIEIRDCLMQRFTISVRVSCFECLLLMGG